MRTIEIDVECYSGGRADETPRRISFNDQVHIVTRLLSEAVEQPVKTKQETRRYKVLTDQGVVLEILRTAEGKWRCLNRTQLNK